MSSVPLTSGKIVRQPVTRLLVEKALACRYDAIPADIRELARQCAMDTIAVTLAARDEPVFRFALDEALDQGGNAQATVLGTSHRVSEQQAALVNGTAAHALDFDDVNLMITGHPSVAILPGLLALAERRNASGRDFLAAFVAGYEMACRVGALVQPDHYARGFHATATVGSIGAATACAHLMGLDAATTARAVGIAVTQASGLRSMFGTMCKPLHAGLAARNGVNAARLAARGLTSREDSLECVQGFADTQSSVFDPDAALAEPKGGYWIRANLFKYHAACYGTHSAIECARELRGKYGIAAADVRRATVRMNTLSDRICNIQRPTSGLEAKFSVRMITAMALAGVDTARLSSYSDETCKDPTLLALLERIRVELVADLPMMGAELRVETADGAQRTASHDSGVPSSDIAAQGRRIAGKFDSLVEPVLGAQRAAALRGVIAELDAAGDVATLVALCAPR
jgi:2-methylcitrate dehydratase PrpD